MPDVELPDSPAPPNNRVVEVPNGSETHLAPAILEQVGTISVSPLRQGTNHRLVNESVYINIGLITNLRIGEVGTVERGFEFVEIVANEIVLFARRRIRLEQNKLAPKRRSQRKTRAW